MLPYAESFTYNSQKYAVIALRDEDSVYNRYLVLVKVDDYLNITEYMCEVTFERTFTSLRTYEESGILYIYFQNDKTEQWVSKLTISKIDDL